MLDFFRELQSIQTILLSVIAFLFASTAILASYQKAADIRLYCLITLTFICLGTGFYADLIFETLNRNRLYEAFFINLSVELASAWIIFPMTIGLWYIFDNIYVPLLVCFLVVGGIVCFLHPQHLYMLKEAGIRTKAIQDLVLNIKFELISIVFVLLALMIIGAVGTLFNLDALEVLHPVDRWLTGTIIIISVITLMGAFVYMGLQLPAYNPRGDNIHTAIIGALITTVIVADWIGTSSHTFTIMCFAILATALILILQIEYPIWLDANASMAMATELLGALIAGILLNRKWLWHTRKAYDVGRHTRTKSVS